MRAVAAVLTRLALAVALILAIVWGVAGIDVEPWVTSFALLAAVLGVFVEPWLATRDQRRGLLRDLGHELFRNLQVLQDPKLDQRDGSFVIYPRVATAVVDTAISSGLFSGGSDEKLIKELHGWHELAGEYNRRVSFTEQQTATAALEDRRSWQDKLVEGNTLHGIREQLVTLSRCLVEDYAKQSGIDSDTVLFAGGAPTARDD